MNITFGRFTDAFKGKEKNEMWNEIEKLFETKDYVKSYLLFFEYLREDGTDNVLWGEDKGKINFIVKQGSKELRGIILGNDISVTANIAEFEKLPVAISRRLLEMNYNLNYSEFAVKGNIIMLKFSTFADACPPARLYYALNEMALRADKQDDILIDEFKTLKPVDYFKTEVSPEIREVKYKYLIKWINEALAKIESINAEKYSGGLTFYLLAVNYRLDYLLNPQGSLTNILEKINWSYFSNDGKNVLEKIEEIKSKFMSVLAKPKESIINEFYEGVYTFGVTRPAQHKVIQDSFKNNLENVTYYVNNKMNDIALSIYEYVAGYCLFVYAVNPPTKHLFDTVFRLLHPDYFKELGFTGQFYYSDEKRINKNLLEEKIDSIIQNGKGEYPLLEINKSNLKYDNLLSFMKTFFNEINNLNYNPE